MSLVSDSSNQMGIPAVYFYLSSYLINEGISDEVRSNNEEHVKKICTENNIFGEYVAVNLFGKEENSLQAAIKAEHFEEYIDDIDFKIVKALVKIGHYHNMKYKK